MITIVIKKVSLKVTHEKRAGKGPGKADKGDSLVVYGDGDIPSRSWMTTWKSPWCFPDASGWGRLTVAMGKLVRTERRKSFRHRPSFVGPFRYPHRAMVPISDGRAWHHKQSNQGGTVLVDKSGSMCITPAMVIDFLHKRPLATVAIYEGWQENHAGILTVIAKANRYAVIIPEYAGGNVVDGPALRWLARQEKPRLWVCDGGLTGVGDNKANPSMNHEAKIIVKRAAIKQVRNLAQAVRQI